MSKANGKEVRMSFITIIEIILVLTVLGLFACAFKRQKSVNDDVVFSYARYMIYLLVAELLYMSYFNCLSKGRPLQLTCIFCNLHVYNR